MTAVPITTTLTFVIFTILSFEPSIWSFSCYWVLPVAHALDLSLMLRVLFTNLCKSFLNPPVQSCTFCVLPLTSLHAHSNYSCTFSSSSSGIPFDLLGSEVSSLAPIRTQCHNEPYYLNEGRKILHGFVYWRIVSQMRFLHLFTLVY